MDNNNESDNMKKPAYPLFVYYVEDGAVVDMYQLENDDDDLYNGLEYFDTETDGYVIDSEGRFVRLRVKNWEGSKAIVEFEDTKNRIINIDKNNNSNILVGIYNVSSVLDYIFSIGGFLALILASLFLLGLHLSIFINWKSDFECYTSCFYILLFDTYLIWYFKIIKNYTLVSIELFNDNFLEITTNTGCFRISINEIQTIEINSGLLVIRTNNKNAWFSNNSLEILGIIKVILKRSNINVATHASRLFLLT